jgi:hypothetical protein
MQNNVNSQIIYTHREDEIPSLLDVISSKEGEEITLVVPERARIFRDLLNLKLLKKECEKMHKSLSITTRDSAGIALAKKAGIPVEQLTEGDRFLEDWENSGAKARGTVTQINPNKLVASPARPVYNVAAPVAQIQSGLAKRSRGLDIVVRKKTAALSAQQPQPIPAAERIERIKIVKDTPVKKEHPADAGKAEIEKPVYKDHVVEEQPVEDEKPEKGAKKKIKIPKSAILGAVAAVCAVAAAYLFIKPSATVVVYPKEETMEFEMDISGRTDISTVQADKAVIPLERLKVDDSGSKDFPSSGNRMLTSNAHGTVTMYNEYSSSPQAIVATTRFLSESGKVFRTPKAVTVPGAKVENGKTVPGSADVEIFADKPGEDYNIGPSKFTIPGFAGTPKEKKFYAISNAAFTGGYNGQTAVVEEKDIDAAKEEFIPSEKSRVEQLLRKKFPSDLHLIDGALNVTSSDVQTSPRAGEAGTTFKLSAHTTAEALLFREEDVLAIIDPNIALHLASRYVMLPETRTLSYAVRQSDSTLGRLAFTVLVSVKTKVILDEGDILKKMAGMDITQTRQFFANENQIERADLSLWPFWARHLPTDTSKIRITIGQK